MLYYKLINYTKLVIDHKNVPPETLLDRIARTTYVDAVYCYRPSVVCRSVTLVSSAKTAEPIEMPFMG